MVTDLKLILLPLALSWICLGAACTSPPLRETMTFAITMDARERVFVRSNLGPMFLDTGAPRCMIDEGLANRLKLARLEESANLVDVTGATVEAVAAVIPKLVIASKDPARPWEIHNLAVFVVKDFQKTSGVPMLLGMDVLNRRIWELNLQGAEIKFLSALPSGPDCTTVRVSSAGGRKTGTPAVPVQAEGAAPFYARVDTGYNGYLNVGKDAWEKVPVHSDSKRHGNSAGFLKTERTLRAVASSKIKVGNVTLVNCPVTLVEWRHHLIGVSLLRQTRLAIDWDRKKAVFRLPPHVMAEVAKAREKARAASPATAGSSGSAG